MTTAVHAVDILRVGPEHPAHGRDLAVAEEPLEIRLGGTTFVVIMRTPGADRELVAGFLLSERIIESASEIASIRYCSDEGGDQGSGIGDQGSGIGDQGSVASDPRSPIPDPRSPDQEVSNVINVWLTGQAAERAAGRLAERRHVTANSSCGVCGRRSIDDLMEGIHPIESMLTVPRAVITSLPDRLRAAQQVFDATGGLHAAGLFDRDGQLLAVAEDVGRHNAVDKVLGASLMQGRVPLVDRILFVSGRTSFEIVQKAVVAGVPIVASVSAPSSLAIELASEAHLTLLGFVRDASFNIYTGEARVVL
jgi:FdhD protein